MSSGEVGETSVGVGAGGRRRSVKVSNSSLPSLPSVSYFGGRNVGFAPSVKLYLCPVFILLAATIGPTLSASNQLIAVANLWTKLVL